MKEKTGLDIKHLESKCSYFAVVNNSYKDLLTKNILAIPATVFGSKYNNLSIITPLYYLDKI